MGILSKIESSIVNGMNSILDPIDYSDIKSYFSDEDFSLVLQAIDEEKQFESFFLSRNYHSMSEIFKDIAPEKFNIDEDGYYYLTFPHCFITIFEEEGNVFIDPVIEIYSEDETKENILFDLTKYDNEKDSPSFSL